MKYLIVDDSKIIRETVIHPIPQNVDQIIECSDGDEALEAYSNFLPDWVLMDIKMKKVNGLVATKNIKRKFPEAKVAVLTSYDSKTYRSAAEIVGADRFYSKDNLGIINNDLHGI